MSKKYKLGMALASMMVAGAQYSAEMVKNKPQPKVNTLDDLDEPKPNKAELHKDQEEAKKALYRKLAIYSKTKHLVNKKGKIYMFIFEHIHSNHKDWAINARDHKNAFRKFTNTFGLDVKIQSIITFESSEEYISYVTQAVNKVGMETQ